MVSLVFLFSTSTAFVTKILCSVCLCPICICVKPGCIITFFLPFYPSSSQSIKLSDSLRIRLDSGLACPFFTINVLSGLFPVYSDGRVCISILHAPGDDPMGYESSAERWSPVQSVEKILLSVVSMLAGEPYLTSPHLGVVYYYVHKVF